MDTGCLKYHCELNPIERVWGQAKRYCHTNCNYWFSGLEKIILQALDSISTDVIRKYFRRVHEYHRAYRGGQEVENEVVKKLRRL